MVSGTCEPDRDFSLPGLPIVRHEPVAEERFPHLLHDLGLVDVLGVRDVDRIDDLRVTDEVRLAGQHAGDEDIAVFFVRLEYELSWVSLEIEGPTPEPVPFVAWNWLGWGQLVPIVGS